MDELESNFFYSSHKLILELAEGATWFWDAQKDYHGTSVNSVSLRKGVNWPRLARDDPDAAQWTLVSVFPRAVVNAAGKKAANEIY